jgi:hypothetical protein
MRFTLALSLIMAMAALPPRSHECAPASRRRVHQRCDCVAPAPPRVAQGEASAVLLVVVESVGSALVTLHGSAQTYEGRHVRAQVLAAWPAGTDGVAYPGGPLPPESPQADDSLLPRGRDRLARPYRDAVAESLVVVLATGAAGGDCGYAFRRGDTYLVYAVGAPDDLRTSICTRTRPASEAAEDLAALGPPAIDRRRGPGEHRPKR